MQFRKERFLRPLERDSLLRGTIIPVTAIIETGGKQYRVNEGDVLYIEKLGVDEGEKVVFDRVIAITDGDGSKFGTPTVEGASVTASVVKNGKARKIRVFKMKPKKGYRRRQGHRQPYTQIKIEAITNA